MKSVDKPLLKSDSKFDVISQMLLNHKKTQQQNSLADNVAATKKNEIDKKQFMNFIKLIRKITRVDANLGIINVSDIIKLVIKENYAPSKPDDTDISINPEMSRIQNPLFFVNSILSLVNFGARVLIDKISNKITGNAQARPLVTTIIKAVITTPISLVQLVVGGIAESVNWVSQFIAKKIFGKHTVKVDNRENDDDYTGAAKYAQRGAAVHSSIAARKTSEMKGVKAFFCKNKVKAVPKANRQSIDVEMGEIDRLRPKT